VRAGLIRLVADVLHGTWQLLDRAPRGRGDKFENWPRRDDEY
jgi:predicted dithiol-disulfide oxidoreductase (DUF899 family)